jgi:hypothetical protein
MAATLQWRLLLNENFSEGVNDADGPISCAVELVCSGSLWGKQEYPGLTTNIDARACPSGLCR